MAVRCRKTGRRQEEEDGATDETEREEDYVENDGKEAWISIRVYEDKVET